ncbi:unnamed protein product [Merluccius merluccius]
MAHCRQLITDDCEDLLARFQKTESVRFEVFAKIWREMKFSEMFYGSTEVLKGKTFSQQILTTAYRYFLPPYTFQIRVGGLYLLYGLYSSQLARPKVQIQVALKDWEEVKKFEKDAAQAQHFDATYILRKLFSQHAFYFAAMPRHLSKCQKKRNEKESVCEEFMERASRPQELVNNELLEELSNVHEHYERYRLSKTLVHPDLVPQIHQIVTDFTNWQFLVVSSTQPDHQGGVVSSLILLFSPQSSQRAELLAAIKSRSYGQAVEASKSRRHRQVEVHSQVPQRAPRKPSLKSRTDTILFKNVPRKKREFKW